MAEVGRGDLGVGNRCRTTGDCNGAARAAAAVNAAGAGGGTCTTGAVPDVEEVLAGEVTRGNAGARSVGNSVEVPAVGVEADTSMLSCV